MRSKQLGPIIPYKMDTKPTTMRKVKQSTDDNNLRLF
jgi:hypothetical protein